MNAPKASYMTGAMHGILFINAGDWIPEASSVDCRSHIME